MFLEAKARNWAEQMHFKHEADQRSQFSLHAGFFSAGFQSKARSDIFCAQNCLDYDALNLWSLVLWRRHLRKSIEPKVQEIAIVGMLRYFPGKDIVTNMMILSGVLSTA